MLKKETFLDTHSRDSEQRETLQGGELIWQFDPTHKGPKDTLDILNNVIISLGP